MDKTIGLPLPGEMRSLIREYASDRIGVHQNAHLMHTLRMFELCESRCFKMVVCDFESGEYFTIQKEGGVVRVCDLFFHFNEGGEVHRPCD